jgi:hypothetical protein
MTAIEYVPGLKGPDPTTIFEEEDSGGGVEQVFLDSPTTPDDPTKPALSFPSGGGELSQWDPGSQTWV